MNVTELLRAAAERHPDRTALVAGLGADRRVLSYRALIQQTGELRRELEKRGLRAGDRVLLAVPLAPETYIALVAALSLGLIVMYVDPGQGLRALTRSLRAYAPRAILLGGMVGMIVRIIPELKRIPVRVRVDSASRRQQQREQAALTILPRANADGALLTFTSGSTAEPKAVLRTHGFLREQLRMLQPLTATPGVTAQIVTMPMFVMSNLAEGITSILPACDVRHPSAINFQALWTQLEQESAGSLLAAPALVEGLVKYVAARGGSLGKLVEIATGGGPVRLTLPSAVRRIAPHCSVRIVYGSTEAEPIATLSSDALQESDILRSQEGAGLLVGFPVPGCDLAIIDDRPGRRYALESPSGFARLQLPAGKIGEIVVSGKHVLDSYLDPSRNDGNKFRVGKRTWHRTGDAGYLDSRGRLWLVGRCKAALRDAWGTVYPFQVEIPACQLPNVARAALLQFGEQRSLVVETHNGQSIREVLARSTLLEQARISRVITVRALPMDRRHNSKVDYGRVEQLMDGHFLQLRERLLLCLEAIRRGLVTLRRVFRLHAPGSQANQRISRRLQREGGRPASQ